MVLFHSWKLSGKTKVSWQGVSLSLLETKESTSSTLHLSPHLQGGLKTVGSTLQCSGEQRNPSPRGLCVYSEVKNGESPTEAPRAAQSSHSPQFLSHLQALQQNLHIWKWSAEAPASPSQTQTHTTLNLMLTEYKYLLFFRRSISNPAIFFLSTLVLRTILICP